MEAQAFRREMPQARDDTQAGPVSAPVDPSRRRVLASLLTAYTASLIPWAQAVPVTDAGHGAYAAVAAILVGRRMLDAELTARTHDALAALDPQLDPDCQALLDLIAGQQIDPEKLQSALDASHSRLAPLPRRIMRAWCLGVVGSGEAAHCIAYENALDAVIVADVLKPPTYAYGIYASWSSPPVAGQGDGPTPIG